MTPICKFLGHLNRFLGEKVRGRWAHNRWKAENGMDEPKESLKRQTDTHYPPDSVILGSDHVNGVRRSWANEVMAQWRSMMIRPLVDIIISGQTPMKR